jgi:Methyltransferase domain
MLDALRKLTEELERDNCLFKPSQLRERIEALDRFDFLDLAPGPGTDEAAGATYDRARTIAARLEAANFAVYEAIRREVRLGRGAEALLKWLPASTGLAEQAGYDYLDEVVAGIFEFEEPATVNAHPAAEMVFYQPTPARHIFDLLSRTALTERDVLVDLGSGLGHVPLLTGICTKARSIGIEFEPEYVNSAQRTAERLLLKRVSFIQQDAQAADLTEGTVFYLYTPFRGKMLRSVLDSLRREAETREIRVCTYGPCTLTVADEEWMETSGPSQVDRISVFRSRPGQTS